MMIRKNLRLLTADVVIPGLCLVVVLATVWCPDRVPPSPIGSIVAGQDVVFSLPSALPDNDSSPAPGALSVGPGFSLCPGPFDFAAWDKALETRSAFGLASANPNTACGEALTLVGPGAARSASGRARELVVDRLNGVKQQCRRLSRLSDRQWANAREMEGLLRDRGFGNDNAMIAMAANVMLESEFNERCQNFADAKVNGKPSNGLFQLTGAPLTVKGNVDFLVGSSTYSPRIRRWYSDLKAKNWDAGDAAYEFARQVLRPAARHRESRRALARDWLSFLGEE